MTIGESRGEVKEYHEKGRCGQEGRHCLRLKQPNIQL